MTCEKILTQWDRYLDIFRRYGAKSYLKIVDEEFFGNLTSAEEYDRAKQLFESILKRKDSLNYDISCRLDQVVRDDFDLSYTIRILEIFKLARKTGLRRIFLGLESASASQLQRYNKGFSIKQAAASIRLLSALGFELKIGFILFDPLMTKNELRDNLLFLLRDDLLIQPRELTNYEVQMILNNTYRDYGKNKQLYTSITYLASSLELLRGCSYLQIIQNQHAHLLESDKYDCFGRLKCSFLEKDISLVSFWCNKWINANFPLAYIVKGCSKQCHNRNNVFDNITTIYRTDTLLLMLFLIFSVKIIEQQEFIDICSQYIKKSSIDYLLSASSIEEGVESLENELKEYVKQELSTNIRSYSGEIKNIDIFNATIKKWYCCEIATTSDIRKT